MSSTNSDLSGKNISGEDLSKKYKEIDSNDKKSKFLCGGLQMLIFGCMMSSKSSKLIHELTICADIDAGLKVLYVNHIRDDRKTEKHDDTVSTHNSSFKEMSSKIDKRKISNLSELNVDCYDVIGIDEGQFFDDLEKTVREWVLIKKKQVYVASLDGDFTINSFGQAHNLICLCEPGGLIKLSSHCMLCMKISSPYKKLNLVPAGFSLRLNNSKETILPGGTDIYRSVCLKCHQEYYPSGDKS